MLWQRLWTICLYNFCSAFFSWRWWRTKTYISQSPSQARVMGWLGFCQIHLLKIWKTEVKQRPSSAPFCVFLFVLGFFLLACRIVVVYCPGSQLWGMPGTHSHSIVVASGAAYWSISFVLFWKFLLEIQSRTHSSSDVPTTLQAPKSLL